MKAAMYKGRTRLFNRLTSIWTRGPYSHMELVLDSGSSFSSSFRDDGVRKKDIDYTLHPENWGFIDIGPESDYPGLHERMNSIMGKKYDVRGLFGFVIRPVSDSRNKLFCSEAVMHVLGYPDAWRFDPNTASAVLSFAAQRLKNG